MSLNGQPHDAGGTGHAAFKSQPLALCYEFDSIRVDLLNCVVTKDGAEITLSCKAFDLLALLVKRRGQVVTRNELLEILWSDPIVEESNLTQTIYLLRKALGEGPSHKYIETLPKRGYRFNAQVTEVTHGGDAGGSPATSPAVDAERAPLEEEQPAAPDERLPPPAAPRARINFRPSLFVAVTLAGLGLAAVLLYSFGNRGRAVSPGNAGAVRTLAILPFKNLGPNEEDAVLGLGLTDSLITKFSNFGQIRVLPTSVVHQYIGYGGDSLSLARTLEVDAILEGTVQRAGDRIRVTVRLLSNSGGQPLWGGQFDEYYTNLLDVQDQMAEQIAKELRLEISAGKQSQFTKRPTHDPEAYEAYTRGLYFWGRRTSEGYKKSLEYFGEAIKRDPNYALAHAALADTFMLIGYDRCEDIFSRGEAYSKARAAVVKALELDPNSAEAHTTLAFVQTHNEHDFQAAEKSFQTALSLNPDFPTAHHRYGLFLTSSGRMGEALHHLRRAQELDPVSAPINNALAVAHYYIGEYDQMIKYARKALEIDPNYQPALVHLGQALEQKGDYREAVSVLEKAKSLPMAHLRVGTLQALGHAYAVSGNRQGALKILNEIMTAEPDADTPLAQVIILTGLGEKDRALDLLENLFDQLRAPPLPTLFRLDPRFNPLRNEARFQGLMQRYNH